MENAAFPDGCSGQTLPRQLGVSHEPWQHSGQVLTQWAFSDNFIILSHLIKQNGYQVSN